MKVLIVEDEAMARDKLSRCLTSTFPDIEIIGETASVQETLDWLRMPGHTPDIIFMDVELSDGDCFEIFRQCEIKSSVIMTTAYDNYAVKAFEAGSVDYLLKPIDTEALKRAVERCRKRVSHDFDALLRTIGQAPGQDYRRRFVIHLGEQYIPVQTEDVAYFYSESKSSYLVTSDGRRYILDHSLDSLEEELDPKDFFRISRGCIIGLGAIQSITRQGSGRLLVNALPKPEFEMTVSRSRVEDFLRWLD